MFDGASIRPKGERFSSALSQKEVGVDGFSQAISHHADLLEAGTDAATRRRFCQASRIAEQHGTFPDWPSNHATRNGATIPCHDLAVCEPVGMP